MLLGNVSKFSWSWLKNKSIIKLWKIKEIDKKRIVRYLWKLPLSYQNEVDEKLIKVFNIKK